MNSHLGLPLVLELGSASLVQSSRSNYFFCSHGEVLGATLASA